MEVPLPTHPPAGPFTGRLTEAALHYQRVLEKNPNEPGALMGMSLVAMASQQSLAAVQMAQAAVHVAPQMGSAWVTLGQALRSAKRSKEAEQAYANAIELDGVDPLARTGLGELKIATDRAEEAIAEFELALRRNPLLLPAHIGKGHALACLNRFEEALDCYDYALSIDSKLAEAEFAAGFALARMGRPKDAERRYRRALFLRPDFAAAWMNLGCLLRDQGREFLAKTALERSVQLLPEMTSGWINLGLLERDLKNWQRAEECLRKAFEFAPDSVEVHVAWAHFCTSRKDVAGAWSWLRWALARNPNHDEAVNSWGILLHNERRFAEAVEIFRRAEELGNKPAVSNRGNSLLDLNDIQGALEAHRRAAELSPHTPGALYNLALSQIRTGDWTHGWPAYEARWSFREVHRHPRVFNKPRWNGERLSGQRVLLHAEQGLGDTIQFCRYAELAVERGAYPILHVQDAVEHLLRSLPAVRAGKAEVARLHRKAPAFDLECPLMSLPAAFETTVETTPWPGPYLSADPDEVARKWEQFPTRPGTRLRVGLAWAGNSAYKADYARSTRLDTLLPLLRTPGITWISLQKGELAEQIAELPKDVVVADGSSQDRNLADTAALIDTLDLVISTDTCIPHLAGAMGKPVWMLLAHFADWRWMQEIETTPWYPTAWLIRQSGPGDWASAMHRAIHALQAWF